MISWQSNNKVLTGLFKEVKGPIVFAEAEDKSPASVSLKSLSPESQAYVASEIRNRKSRLFDLLASDKPEATMQQDVVATATRVQLPARITEVITSKGRALKVNLSFEGLPRRVTTRQQMTLRSDPEDFVNVRAGDLVLFEGKPSAYVKPCAFCSGTALAKCPACRGTGGVLGPVRTELRTMPDGRVVSSSGPTVVPCGSCGGSGKTKCSHPVPSKSEEWTPLERKRESRTVASVSNSKGQQNLVVELQDMLICIVPEATKEPLYFGSTPKEEHR
jgi:hypothetical protein